MGIRKEYVCLAHGEFEGDQPLCPHGCTVAIERHFRSAPALKSPRTGNIDRTLAVLAREFGYSDLSNKNGAVAGGNGNPARAAPDFRPVWKDVPKGDLQKAGGVIEKRDGSIGGASEAVKAERIAPNKGEVGFSDIAKNLRQPAPKVDPRMRFGDAGTLAAAVKSVS